MQPRASRLQLAGVEAGRLKLRLTAPPADGAANDQARRLLADAFGVGVTRVELVSGAGSRNKVFLVREPGRLPDVIVAP